MHWPPAASLPPFTHLPHSRLQPCGPLAVLQAHVTCTSGPLHWLFPLPRCPYPSSPVTVFALRGGPPCLQLPCLLLRSSSAPLCSPQLYTDLTVISPLERISHVIRDFVLFTYTFAAPGRSPGTRLNPDFIDEEAEAQTDKAVQQIRGRRRTQTQTPKPRPSPHLGTLSFLLRREITDLPQSPRARRLGRTPGRDCPIHLPPSEWN